MKTPVKIQFLGDVSLNATFCDPLYFNGFKTSLEKFEEYIGQPDFRVINWEAPVSKDFNFNPLKQPAIATTEISANFYCKNFKFDLACLGNNHVGDCYQEGLINTVACLTENQRDFYGASSISPEDVKDYFVTIQNQRFAFISFVGSETNPKIAPNDPVFINLIDESKVIEKIVKLKKNADHVILTLHWGIELLQYPSLEQRRLAKKFIDAGASVVIGHHSHTLQGVEEYNGGLIFYSLGNFIFSGVKGRETFAFPNMCLPTGCVEIIFDDSIQYKFLPFLYNNEGIQLLQNEQLVKAMANFKSLSRSFLLNPKIYSYKYRLNAFLNWGIRFPLFMVKVKGGFFQVLRQYANPTYFKIIMKYFR